jgi:hypothetical protein
MFLAIVATTFGPVKYDVELGCHPSRYNVICSDVNALSPEKSYVLRYTVTWCGRPLAMNGLITGANPAGITPLAIEPTGVVSSTSTQPPTNVCPLAAGRGDVMVDP